MSKRSIAEVIDYDFHTPNTPEVREYLEKHFEVCDRFHNWSDEAPYITPQREISVNTYVYTTYSSWGKSISTEQFKELIGMSKDKMPEQKCNKTIEELFKEAGMTNTTFSKSQLHTGMILEFANGERARVLLGTKNVDIVSGDTWFPLDDYSDECLFINETEPHIKVIKVIQPKYNSVYNTLTPNDYTIVWERKELSPEQLELQELEKQQREIADKIAELSNRIK